MLPSFLPLPSAGSFLNAKLSNSPPLGRSLAIQAKVSIMSQVSQLSSALCPVIFPLPRNQLLAGSLQWRAAYRFNCVVAFHLSTMPPSPFSRTSSLPQTFINLMDDCIDLTADSMNFITTVS
jgi:hypothetical protein